MGSAINTAVNVAVQTSVNNILQQSETYCFANCNGDIENINIIVLNGSKVDGIEIEAVCTSQSLCSMRNELDSISTQQLEAIQYSEATFAGQAAFVTWPGFSINTTNNNTVQTLSNTVTQVIDSTCEASANNNISNINVLVGNNSEVGGFYIGTDGTATADCNMENSAKSSVSQTAITDQTAISTGGSVLLIIMLIIAVVIIAIGLSYLAYKNKSETLIAKRDVCIAALDTNNKDAITAGCENFLKAPPEPQQQYNPYYNPYNYYYQYYGQQAAQGAQAAVQPVQSVQTGA